MKTTLYLPTLELGGYLGIIELVIGYESESVALTDTLSNWRRQIDSKERANKPYTIMGGKRYVGNMGFEVVVPITNALHRSLKTISDAPRRLSPDEGFCHSMLSEFCSSLYNGGHIVNNEGDIVPFIAEYRNNYPMFKIIRYVGFTKTDIKIARVNNFHGKQKEVC